MKTYQLNEATLDLLLRAAVKRALQAQEAIFAEMDDDEGPEGDEAAKPIREPAPDPIDAPHVRALIAEIAELRGQVGIIADIVADQLSPRTGKAG